MKMSERGLAEAGITDPDLQKSYEACRRVNARHGRTYYLATLLLPPQKRPFVHALYGFARWADEIVDSCAEDRASRFTAWRRELDGPVVPAFLDTVRRWDISWRLVEDFLDAMQMDLSVTGYATFDELLHYMHGSAVAIALQMLAVLEPPDPARASSPARDLGIAFQLSNFIRDVGEDLQRGRIYLPAEDLEAAGVTPDDVTACAKTGVINDGFRTLIAGQISRARTFYARAEPGVDLLPPDSRDCIRTAFVLYQEILDGVERADYRVLDRRVSVPLRRRLAVAGPAGVRAWRTRRVDPAWPVRDT